MCAHAGLGRGNERAPSLGDDYKDVDDKFSSGHLDPSSQNFSSLCGDRQKHSTRYETFA